MNTQAETMADLAQLSRNSGAPFRTKPLPMMQGGVDPLGLRQLNFNLMDLALPGINNVANRLRVYTFLAWAWWKAARLAEAEGRAEVKVDRLWSYVERMEVLFAVSHLAHEDFIGFLGRDTLNAKVVRQGGYDFGSSAWLKFRRDRKLASSFMAPVAYGPSAKIGLGLGVIAPTTDGAFAPVEEVMPAVAAFDTCLEPISSEPAFAQLDGGYVSLADMRRYYTFWRAAELTPDEVVVGRRRLYEKEGALPRRQTIDALVAILNAAQRPMTSAELRHAIASSRVNDHVFTPPDSLAGTMKVWRALLARQLFRISLESLLNWVLSVCTVPMTLRELTKQLSAAERVPLADTVADWMDNAQASAAYVADPFQLIEKLSQERQFTRPDLALEGLRACILICRQEGGPDTLYTGQLDRLPLAIASDRLAAMARLSFVDGLEQIIAEWIIGQHVYWAVGRSGDDTQRLRLMLDEGGWLSFYGKPRNAAATPDRLVTILRLMADCQFVREDVSGGDFAYWPIANEPG